MLCCVVSCDATRVVWIWLLYQELRMKTTTHNTTQHNNAPKFVDVANHNRGLTTLVQLRCKHSNLLTVAQCKRLCYSRGHSITIGYAVFLSRSCVVLCCVVFKWNRDTTLKLENNFTSTMTQGVILDINNTDEVPRDKRSRVKLRMNGLLHKGKEVFTKSFKEYRNISLSNGF